jgi:hypothetical protein
MKAGSSVRAVATVVALTGAAALACGHCDEDRIAAVYDYALAQRTVALKHEIMFFAWDGSVPLSDDSRKKILALGEAVSGVDMGSTRVSMQPAALAVAFAPQRNSAQAVEAALKQKLASMKLTLVRLPHPVIK